MKEDVLNYYKNSIGRFNSRLVNASEKNKDDMYHKVIELTNFITDRPFIERLHVLNLGLTKNPVCEVCGVNTKYVRSEDGKPPMFRPTCSAKCMGILKRGVSIVRDEIAAGEKRKQTMIEKYGVEYNSQRAEVKPKIGQHNKDEEFRKRHSERLKQNYYGEINYNIVNDINVLNVLNMKYSVKQIAKAANCSTSLVLQNMWKNNIVVKQHTSNIEIELRNLLNKYNIEYKTNDRTVLNGKELDIYIPSHNLAIECNGLYWHNEDNYPKHLHREKTDMCYIKGIQLLHFFEHEILDKIDLIESMILSKLNKLPKIYARNCKVVVVDSRCARDFFNKNHMQGHTNAKEYIGLEYNEEIVSLLSMSPPRFNLEKYDAEYEIIRFATKKGLTVVGGFSRLIHKYKKYNIITYANKRWSNGNVYRKSNFTHLYDTDVGFFYTKGYEVKSRYADQRPLADVKKDGWRRVFDCGNSVFIKYKSKS